MKSFKITVCFIILLNLAYYVIAEEPESKEEEPYNFWKCTSPTNGFFGLNKKLEPLGLELGASLTNVYQINARGGISTHNHNGRFIGRYDLQLSADLKKTLNLDGSIFLHAQGGWPDKEGIDESSIGSFFGTNSAAIGNRSLDIVEFFYEGKLISDDLKIIIGKIDITGLFDNSAYANDECTQFLNGSLVNNPAVPFPDYGLGLVLNWDITEWLYLRGGMVDAEADSRTSGFTTTFEDGKFFYVAEMGITHNNGTYRFGVWIDGQEKTKLNDEDKSTNNDTGFYTSCDKLLWKENSDPNDTQGLGGFFRYGWANGRYNSLTNFYSFGLQYQGLFNGRDNDVLGVGFSNGAFSNLDKENFPEDYERVVEVYYNAAITPWFHFTPSMQYIANPGGSNSASDAVVFSVRSEILF